MNDNPYSIEAQKQSFSDIVLPTLKEFQFVVLKTSPKNIQLTSSLYNMEINVEFSSDLRDIQVDRYYINAIKKGKIRGLCITGYAAQDPTVFRKWLETNLTVSWIQSIKNLISKR